ncbi:uncharacterized protein [Nicotiana tomentosiformis]|uniref:uncharacterized protein n=1 Tax=Nicotiana tomentosiformis TaxID=4098 RepID=UPI00388C7353
MINFNKCGHHALLTSMDDDNDRKWMERFVVVATRDIIPAITLFFPELWNCTRLQRMILDKEKLTSERDQLLDEQDQIAARLSELEAQAIEAIELEARLQQSEEEAAKWSEVQNVVLAAADREAASTERLNNLEAALNSKVKEPTTAEEKHARMEKKYNKVMEHNKFYNSTIRDLDVSLQAARSERNYLSKEVDQLKKELQRRAASFIVEKIYSMYIMRRKTLEEAKAGVIDFDAEIAKVREVESTARRGLPIQLDATNSSGSSSEFSRTEEEPEGDDDEGQDLDPATDLPISPRGANSSLSPNSGDTVV